MELFIDSASNAEIEKWLNMGVIDGVTTNPSIMLQDGVFDMEKGARGIAALVDPRPVSVEVTTNDLDEMLSQARRFASWAPNIVIKIYISIFAGRVSDEGGNAPEVIENAVRWLEHWEYTSKIIVGSIREAINIQDAALAGAHVITIPPKFLSQMADHKYSRETQRQFVSDAQKALERMGTEA
jgi:transaldolase